MVSKQFSLVEVDQKLVRECSGSVIEMSEVDEIFPQALTKFSHFAYTIIKLLAHFPGEISLRSGSKMNRTGVPMETMCWKYRPRENEPYMSARQINFFREQLLKWRALILRENSQYNSQLNQEMPHLADILDRSVEIMNRNMALLNGQRSRKILLQIGEALERIEDGSYGYCLQSGEEIGLRRLLAWPIATLSIDAQELLERRKRQYSRHMA